MGLFGKNKTADVKSSQPVQPKKGFLGKMADGLLRTRSELGNKIGRLIAYYDTVDDEFFEELEAVLISADMGSAAVFEIISALKEDVKKQRLYKPDDIYTLLREKISDIMYDDTPEPDCPLLILAVGVNGAGKTTALGKLACRFAGQGKSVLMAAGDTFRAAAADQLAVWAERSGARIVRHGEGADSAAVIFDALQAASSRSTDVCLCDTAGRLQNKKNLMDELSKVGRIIDKNWHGNKRTYIVIDATTGQNALSQVRLFNESTPLDGIILTKLDGTAKGGVALAIKKEFGLSVRYVGVGEGSDDLMPFSAADYSANII